jgi:hypothetical protein
MPAEPLAIPRSELRRLRHASGALLLVLTFLISSTPSMAVAAPSAGDVELDLAALVNVERAKRGLGAVRIRPDLVSVARAHSATMASAQRLHGNGNLGTEVTGWQRLGENVAVGWEAEAVHRTLMSSEQHRRNILDAQFTEIGVGVAQAGGRAWITQTFRRPSSGLQVFPASLASFGDVESTSVHAESISATVSRGVTDPCGVARFCPQGPVTRAQFATMLVRALELPQAPDKVFGDVSGPHARDIETLAASGLTLGCRDGMFCPDAVLPREQLATFFARALEVTPTPSPFRDMTPVHDGAVGALFARSIVNGCTTTTFCPRAQVTRAQAASMLNHNLDGEGVVVDAGPVGDFAWEGLNWQRRSWGGGPHYNGVYDPANVVGPDARGHVTLKLSNPTGRAPRAAEFQTTRRGFGYGTYSVVVDKRLDVMQPEVVWGCLFTYDPDLRPGHNEIDLCEASAWGGGGTHNWPVTQGHGYWFDATKAPGQGNVVETFAVPGVAVQTHRMVWAPGKISYETYEGEGFGGRVIKRTVLEGATVPTPAREAIHLNLWVIGGNGGNPDQVAPEQVTVRRLTFTPART